MQQTKIAALIVMVGLSAGAIAQDPHPVDFDKVDWQSASVEDMAFLDAYVGNFRSETYEMADSGKEYHFTVTYEWYNTAKTVVKWTIDTHIPADGVVRRNGEGFYAFDPFENRIMVTGAPGNEQGLDFGF